RADRQPHDPAGGDVRLLGRGSRPCPRALRRDRPRRLLPGQRAPHPPLAAPALRPRRGGAGAPVPGRGAPPRRDPGGARSRAGGAGDAPGPAPGGEAGAGAGVHRPPARRPRPRAPAGDRRPVGRFVRLNLSDEPLTAELLSESLRRTGSAVIAVNGTSMHPTLQFGWRVYLKPARGDELRIGDIAVFRGERYLTIHRLVWREGAGPTGR